jgi:serine O-acetyltransferase
MVGDNSRIGANSVVLTEVPSDSTVVGIPGKIVKRNGVRVVGRLDHDRMVDPVMDLCKQLQQQIDALKQQLDEQNKLLKQENGGNS